MALIWLTNPLGKQIGLKLIRAFVWVIVPYFLDTCYGDGHCSAARNKVRSISGADPNAVSPQGQSGHSPGSAILSETATL